MLWRRDLKGAGWAMAALALALPSAPPAKANDDILTEAMGLYTVRAYVLGLMQYCLDHLAFDPVYPKAQSDWEDRNRQVLGEVDAIVAVVGAEDEQRAIAVKAGADKAAEDANVFMLNAYCWTMKDVVNSGSYDLEYRFPEVVAHLREFVRN